MTKSLAHRGFSGKYPENTMLAFEKAVEEGCHGLEMDVQLTADGVPVVIHDETLDRTANTTGSLRVHEMTYDQIKQYNVSGKFAAPGLVTPVPRFEELLDYVKDKNLLLNIELKNSIQPYPGLEEKVVSLVRQYGLEEQAILASFNHYSMRACRELAPEIPICMIVSAWLVDPVAYLCGLNARHIQPRHTSLTPERVREYKDAGITVCAWTPNTTEALRALVDKDVDYAITDRIDLFNQIVRENH